MAHQGARYLPRGTSSAIGRVSLKKRTLQATLAAMLAFVFILTAVGSSLLAFHDVHVAAASADEAENTLKDAATEAGAEGTPEGFDASLQDLADNPGSVEDRNSFAYLLSRVLFIDYMNATPDGVAAGGKTNPGLNCNVNAPGAGTLVYHNCDVPNLTTEFVQDLVTFATGGQGAKNATVARATVDIPVFGGSVNIPGGLVPVDPASRAAKYTALELFGYNLTLTRYAGEWDHIKVMTAARSLSNFGFMDSVSLSVKATLDGIAAGLETSLDNASSSLASGDIFGAIGSAFSGFFEGAAAGSVNTILDTSDLNVFNSVAWYRVGFGGTTYGARELSQVELAALAKGQYLNLISESAPDDAAVPEDLQGIKGGPPAPVEGISECTYVNASSESVAYGDTSNPPGPTEAQCQQVAQTAYDLRVEERDALEAEAAETGEVLPPFVDSVQYTWTTDGSRGQETIRQWRDNNAATFETAKKYGMACDVTNFDESARATTVATVQACFSTEWQPAADRAIKQQQQQLNNDWVDEVVDPATLNDYLGADPARNFNAPWNRFICVDAAGNDLMNGSAPLTVYDTTGNVNAGCSSVRPPIQNGFFGNGYEPGQPQPAVDTRNAIVDTSIFGTLLDLPGLLTSAGQLGLSIAVFETRLINSVIALTFSPIMETLGLDDIIVQAIEALRESLFFPLAYMVIALAGLSILFRTVKERNYMQQMVSILLICLTFVTGAFLMWRPAEVLQTVDEIPSMVETAIVGSIFSVGTVKEDNTCTAASSGTAAAGTDLDGNVLPYIPADGTRSLMCEAWRVFALTPYTYAQWGTSYDNLFAANTTAPDRFTNTNGALVGDAEVKMGGGVSVRNWGLYQLDVTSSGTSTTENLSEKTGQTSKDFYRIVDAQAGPNNGAGTDGSRFEAWAGKDGFGRVIVGVLSPIVGAFGAVTIISYSITKILISFIVSLMVLFIPIMFLIGLFPTMGRAKLKAYVGTIVGLIIQRIILVTMLAVMFRVLIGVASAASSYLLSAFFSLIICAIFLMYKKQILGMVTQTTGSAFGGSFGGEYTNADNVNRFLPKSVQNYTQMASQASIGAAGGAIGSFLSGGNVAKGARQSAEYTSGMLQNRQRRIGFGVFQGAVNAAQAGADAAKSDLRQNADLRKTRQKVREATLLSQELDAEQKTMKAAEVNVKDLDPAAAYNLGAQKKDTMLEGASDYRAYSKLTELETKLTALEVEKQKLETEAPLTRESEAATTPQELQRLARRRQQGDWGMAPKDKKRYEQVTSDIAKYTDAYDAGSKRLVTKADVAYENSRLRTKLKTEMEALELQAAQVAEEARKREQEDGDK